MRKARNLLKNSIFIFFIFVLTILNFNLFISYKYNNANQLATFANDYSGWQIVDIQASETTYLLWAKDQNGKDHVYTWGLDAYGLLGNGSGQELDNRITSTDDILDEATYYQPTEMHYFDNGTPDDLSDDWTTLPDNIEIQQISLGAKSAMALIYDTNTKQQSIYVWGYSREGSLGIPVEDGNADPVNALFYPTSIEIQGKSIDSSNFVIEQISAGASVSVISAVDAAGTNYIFTAGKDNPNQGLGRVPNSRAPNYLFYPIEYSAEILPNDNSYRVRSVYGSDDGYKGGPSYILINSKATGDHLYASGNDYYGAMLADNPDPSDYTTYPTYQEVTYPDEVKDDDQVDIKSFSTSYTPNDASKLDPEVYRHNYDYYNQIVFVDPSDQDRLYTWGFNLNGNIANGEHGESVDNKGETVVGAMYPVVFPDYPNNQNYTIEESEGDYYSSYAILKDQQNVQHVYYWGNQLAFGTSTYEESPDITQNQQKADPPNYYFLAPVEINYPPGIDLSTDQLKVGFSRNNGFMLTESQNADDDLIQQLYFWGDNGEGQVSGNEDDPTTVVYQPTDILSTFETQDIVFEFQNDGTTEVTFKLLGTANVVQLKWVYLKDTDNNLLISAFNISSAVNGNYTYYQVTFKNLSNKDDYQLYVGYTNDYFGFSQKDISIGNYVYDSNLVFVVLISVFSLLILIIIVIIYTIESKKKAA